MFADQSDGVLDRNQKQIGGSLGQPLVDTEYRRLVNNSQEPKHVSLTLPLLYSHVNIYKMGEFSSLTWRSVSQQECTRRNSQ